MNRKKPLAIAALVLFVGWPLFRAMTSTPGVVRLNSGSPGLIAFLNSMGGPRFEEADYFLSDERVNLSSTASLFGNGGTNNAFTGSLTVYPLFNRYRTYLAVLHELLHVVGYPHSSKPGSIMHVASVYNGSARPTGRHLKDLYQLSGITLIDRMIFWIGGPRKATSNDVAFLASTAYAQGRQTEDAGYAEDEEPGEDNSTAAVRKRSPRLYAGAMASVTALCFLGYIAVGLFILYVIYDGFLKGER